MKNYYINDKRKLARRRRLIPILLAGLVIVCALYLAWSHRQDILAVFGSPSEDSVATDNATTDNTTMGNATMANATAVAAEVPEPPRREPVQECRIQDGDTLSSIFDKHLISQTTLFQIMDADEQILALDILRPGNTLTFTFNPDWSLERMVLSVNPARQVVYRRVDAENFEFEEVIHPGTWVQQTLAGGIEGSFFVSAQSAGLDDQEVASIADLLKGRINFRRDLQAGDTFQVVRRQQFVGDEFTGESQILGIRIICRKRSYDAYLFSDGKYYDRDGNSLMRAFVRYPFKGSQRLSSAFNPRRRHPVTGRVSPHNGADFRMSVGTPVFAPGDGVVTRTLQHRFAGKYIEIRHSDRYSTRYLHLSKFLVRKGQRVKRGDKIALSGNTGRSTGPHLHYEFHVAGRPVDPVTAPIPIMSSISKKDRAAFKTKVAELTADMDLTKAADGPRLTQAVTTN
ncbi:murein DD-endopeptidase [Desulfomicrobium norvegicum]|uniref:Murein DD-endopeptidase n=1 Tax=Desulfomicrobium norvegicum (strain DSM 1741 / NCIMB 8310) TaxID=52561 RepID=A0A8G2F5S5_DESNO|nr:peptidoglycan DD-metalloendopeptidase family protein [Desulfomicrobium norvegicum]SFL64186.1 murein DD-endopeptidase [Desulfomicrobium norvegicum]